MASNLRRNISKKKIKYRRSMGFIFSMWDNRKSLVSLHVLVFYRDDIVRGDPFWMRGSISITNTPECLEEFKEYEVTDRLEKLKELYKKRRENNDS